MKKFFKGLVGGLGSFLGGPIGSFLGGLFGQSSANKDTKRLAREQMAFQERMSSTAYQRATKDLEAAGLNRILALGSPASSPGGQTAVMQNEIQAGLEAELRNASAKQVREQAANTRAQRDVINRQEFLTHNIGKKEWSLARSAEAQRKLDELRMSIYMKNPDLMKRDIIMNGSNAKGIVGAISELAQNLRK